MRVNVLGTIKYMIKEFTYIVNFSLSHEALLFGHIIHCVSMCITKVYKLFLILRWAEHNFRTRIK